MRVVAANHDEVGVVLSKAEAAIVTAALAGHTMESIGENLNLLYDGQEIAGVEDEDAVGKRVMPMFDWLKDWVKE
jgi:hypothetical protein